MAKDHCPEQRSRLTLLQSVLSSRLVTGMGMLFGRHLPPFAGLALGNLVADLICWFKPDVYWVLCANLRQVMGPQADDHALHRVTQAALHNVARNNYELWHLAGRGPDAIRATVHVPPGSLTHINQAIQRGKGIVVAGVHTGNFDLAMLAFATFGLDIQVLGLADPPAGGFDLMDRMRERAGLRLTPISVPALREAVQRLRAGGIVGTGVDRPVSDGRPPIEFFGRPARLPTGHVRLALKTDAAIVVASAERDPRRGTIVHFSPPREMIYTGAATEDLRVNIRRVTALVEEAIRRKPDQWGMFVPVWPGEPPSPNARVTLAHCSSVST